MKYINFKRYKLSTFLKKVNFFRYDFSKIFRFIEFRRYNFSKIFRFIEFRRYNLSKIFGYLDVRRYNFSKILKYLNFKKFKRVPIYAFCALIFSLIVYLSIPFFYDYSKLRVENLLCKDLNIKCSINGSVNYSFFPSPRIKITNFIVKDDIKKKKALANFEGVAIKLPIFKLLHKEGINYTEIDFKKAKINLRTENLKDYINFSKTKLLSKPINLKRSEINFFEKDEFVTSLRDVNIKYRTKDKIDETTLKGIFLGDKIYINLKDKKKDKKISKIITAKLSNSQFFSKITILNSVPKNSSLDGNFLFKLNKNRLTGIFDYQDNQVTFQNSNLRNTFLDGGFTGYVKFIPFFDFNLDLDLNGINFNKFHSFFIDLNKKNENNLFKINKKINGQLQLSANKIYSKYNLIRSFESRINFMNGNISIDQMILNLGKLGAADITGVIKNEKKFTNFNFEHNIFVDNLKRFYSKFGIYNKKKVSSNIFVEGSFDLVNLNMRLNEISGEKKFSEEDVSYIEKEFNNIVLENGYESLFDFLKFKEFAQLILDDSN